MTRVATVPVLQAPCHRTLSDFSWIWAQMVIALRAHVNAARARMNPTFWISANDKSLPQECSSQEGQRSAQPSAVKPSPVAVHTHKSMNGTAQNFLCRVPHLAETRPRRHSLRGNITRSKALVQHQGVPRGLPTGHHALDLEALSPCSQRASACTNFSVDMRMCDSRQCVTTL